MATIRTEVTEIVTGLAMLGYKDLDTALEVRPGHISHVDDAAFDRLAEARAGGDYANEFETAWSNGSLFARSTDGLRGRPPWSVEWKGPHKPPGYEQIPADLRIDHVYLVSCKYGSNILHNAGPAHLFDRLLATRRGERTTDWYLDVAPEVYQELYVAYREELRVGGLPDHVADLTREHRAAMKAASVRGKWPGASSEVYPSFTLAVAQASSERWLQNLTTRSHREEMLWRILRLQAAPYYVLGATLNGEPTRYRVGTPWDFRDRFTIRAFDVWPDAAGQPLVRWRADLTDRLSEHRTAVEGHVEVRWSHGRFSGSPEAKVHLDTPPHEVAGYFPLPEVADR